MNVIDLVAIIPFYISIILSGSPRFTSPLHLLPQACTTWRSSARPAPWSVWSAKCFLFQFHLRSEWWGSSAFSRWSVILLACRVFFTHCTRPGRSWGSSCLWSSSPCSYSPAFSLLLNKAAQLQSLGEPPTDFVHIYGLRLTPDTIIALDMC